MNIVSIFLILFLTEKAVLIGLRAFSSAEFLTEGQVFKSLKQQRPLYPFIPNFFCRI